MVPICDQLLGPPCGLREKLKITWAPKSIPNGLPGEVAFQRHPLHAGHKNHGLLSALLTSAQHSECSGTHHYGALRLHCHIVQYKYSPVPEGRKYKMLITWQHILLKDQARHFTRATRDRTVHLKDRWHSVPSRKQEPSYEVLKTSGTTLALHLMGAASRDAEKQLQKGISHG